MDQGNENDPSMHHGNSNYSLYDAYGSDMVDEVNVVDPTAYPLDTWHPGQYGDDTIDQGRYDTHNTDMQDIDTTQYSHDFQQGQGFEHAGAQFNGFGHETMGDQHAGDQVFDLTAMDIYQHPPPSIYPKLTQETRDYGITLYPL
jgi:hypothetical protein